MKFSHNNILVLLVACASTFSALAEASESELLDPKYQGDFTFLGSINGKTFLTPVNDTKMGWFDARYLCSQFDMQLANLNDHDEFYTVGQYADVSVNGVLWLGASVQDYTGFKNVDGSPMAPYNFDMTYNPICVYYMVQLHTYPTDCYKSQYKPLCETI